MTSQDIYNVYISGILAGHLVRDNRGQIAFKFDERYWEVTDRPILGQYFEDDRKAIYKGRNRKLPPFFANLVPEGQMRTIIAHSLGIDQDDELAILNATGDDLPGAVTISPTTEDVAIPSFSDNAKEVEDNFDIRTDLDIDPVKLRFSLAGVQMKFSVARKEDKILLPAENSLGHWIVKVDSLRFPNLTENEFAIMNWARSADFNVPNCSLLDLNALPDALKSRAPENSRVFVIERYDRQGEKRIHQEDFAQVLFRMPETKYDYISYEQCASIVLQICGRECYKDFLKRLVFMVASGNVDAHLKNWSLLYPDNANPVLTPMYDQVCTIAWPKDLDMRWALTFLGKRDLFIISEDHFARLIKASGGDPIADLKFVRESLERITAAWDISGAANYLPVEHCKFLQQFWGKVPLLKAHASLIKF